MDAGSSAALNQASVMQQVQNGVLRTALDTQQATAQQLVEGAEQASATTAQAATQGSPVNPSERVGQTVDTSA